MGLEEKTAPQPNQPSEEAAKEEHHHDAKAMGQQRQPSQSFTNFVNAICIQDKVALTQQYKLIEKAVKPDDSNLAVLETMTELQTDTLIVVDDDHTILGVVEREQVLSKLMLALTK